ncbi:MAG TPA: hypothetical protein VN372_06775 [Methanospirillum sp.]|nr:hypothetical protein [Methanospirillum sp.]
MYTCTSAGIMERLPDRYLAIWPSPIETVPLLHYTPGGRYLFLSTLGCNLSCPGCVSHILVNNPDLISDALCHASPQEIIHQVREHSCLGAVFCLNEPTVSMETVLKTSQSLKDAGYSVGCASNGCMNTWVLDRFLATMDFMNIGMKGSSDEVYQECSAPCDSDHVFATIQRIHSAGVHLEVSVVYQHCREEQVLGVAQRLSMVSPDIPLHIMRFIPFGDVDKDLEPTPAEAEILLSSCAQFLSWVYLFNTPGTGRLSTICPDCETVLIERSFYGPMGAQLIDWVEHTQCACGVKVPINGSFSRCQGSSPRYRGGYRTSVILSSVASTLSLLGVQDGQVISRILVMLLSGRWLEDLQGYFSTPEGYIEYIRILSSFAGIEDNVQPLLDFYLQRLEEIQSSMLHTQRPRVYCALSHPLLPLYPDKMEVALADRAGGTVVNLEISHNESSATAFTRRQFLLLQPDLIICSGMGKSEVQSFMEYCRQDGLTAPALENAKVYCIPREHSSTGLFWILVLEFMVNVLHPDYDLYDLAEEERRLVELLTTLKS